MIYADESPSAMKLYIFIFVKHFALAYIYAIYKEHIEHVLTVKHT